MVCRSEILYHAEVNRGVGSSGTVKLRRANARTEYPARRSVLQVSCPTNPPAPVTTT